MILAGTLTSVTDSLQWVLNAAVYLISGMCQYNRGLSQLLHTDLHWLNVADRVHYMLAIAVHWFLHYKVPKYLTYCCVAVSDIAVRQRLCSVHHCQLDVLHYKRATLARRAFSVTRPTVWNMLPDELRDGTENIGSH